MLGSGKKIIWILVVFLGISLPALAQETVRDHDIIPEDYFDIATLFACHVSPDGAYAAYVESRWGRGKEGRKNDLWVTNLKDKTTKRLTFDGFGPGQVQWSPDSKFIYFSGKGKVWRLPKEGGEPFAVIRGNVRIKQYQLSKCNGLLYYTTTEDVEDEEWKAMRKKHPNLEYGHGASKLNAVWKLCLVSWRKKKLMKADRVIHEMALSPDSKKIAMITTTDNELIFKEGWSDVDVLDLGSQKLTRVTPEGWRKPHPSPYGWIEGLAWSFDSLALAFSVAFDGYATRIYVSEMDECSTNLFEIQRPDPIAMDGGLVFKGKGRTLCYKGEDRARVRAYAVKDVKNRSQGETVALTPGDVVMGPFSFSEDGEVLAGVVQSTTRLGDIHVVKNGQYEKITHVNPQADRWKLPQISIVKWKGADNDEVEGILELPPNYKPEDGPLPLIVELHGGPTAATKFYLRLWIYGRAVMAARGYALFSPNYHGSTGYGDKFTSKLVGRENDIEVIDIRTGIEMLIHKGIADKDRMGVMGWSNGGFLTSAMITNEPDLSKAACSGAGVLDQALQWSVEDTPGHVVNYMQGLPWEKPEAYIKGSPLYKLHRVKTPTIIHVGGGDPRVPPAHSRALYRGLHHYLGVPVQLIVYPNQAHGLGTHEFRLAKIKWDIAWFDRYLFNKTK